MEIVTLNLVKIFKFVHGIMRGSMDKWVKLLCQKKKLVPLPVRGKGMMHGSAISTTALYASHRTMALNFHQGLLDKFLELEFQKPSSEMYISPWRYKLNPSVIRFQELIQNMRSSYLWHHCLPLRLEIYGKFLEVINLVMLQGILKRYL